MGSGGSGGDGRGILVGEITIDVVGVAGGSADGIVEDRSLQRRAAREHIRAILHRLDGEGLTGEDGAEVVAPVEHLAHVLDVLRIEIGEVERGEARTEIEHAAHVLDILGIEMGEIDVVEVGASAEHVVHALDAVGVEILHTIDILEQIVATEPGRAVGRAVVGETGIEDDGLDGVAELIPGGHLAVGRVRMEAHVEVVAVGLVLVIVERQRAVVVEGVGRLCLALQRAKETKEHDKGGKAGDPVAAGVGSLRLSHIVII